MKLNAISALISLAGLLPLPLFGLGAEGVSRPNPPAEVRAPDKAVTGDSSTRGAIQAEQNQELLSSLKGLVIAATAESALQIQSSGKPGLEIIGFSEQETIALRKIGESVMGKPVTLRTLTRLTSRIEAAFRQQGRMFMRISYPDQEITSGVIAIRITPARAGQILIAGKPAFGMKFCANSFRTRTGEPIARNVVLDDLDWLKKNSLRRATISYSDGVADDELDLRLKLRAEKPWRVYSGIDNQLSDDLGDERFFLGFQHGDVFGMDQRFTGQYTAALELASLQGVSGIYEIPLPIRHLLQISAGYTESETDALGPLDQSGKFSRVAVSYVVPMPRWHGIGHDWRAGMEFRNNDYLFPNNSSETVKFFQIETGWAGRRADRFGSTRLDAALVYSPGQGILGSEDEDFIALGGSGAEALIARVEVDRSLKVAEIATLFGRLRGQWADSKLLSSDQISPCGATRVRGFDETVGYASSGLVGTLELQSRAFATQKTGDFSAVIFADGAVLNRDAPWDVGELASAGLGLRWKYADWISAKVDYGIPLTFPDRLDGDPMTHFSISVFW